MFAPFFHAFVVVLNSYTIWYDQQYLDIPFPTKEYSEMSFKARLMFFTLWCLILQTVYFSISLLADFFDTEHSPQKTPLIQKLRGLIFSLAFPTALCVTTGFWTIYNYDNELIFPDYVAAIVPVWANVVMHILISIFIIIELLVTKISYPSRKVGLGIPLAFNSSYLVWMHYLHDTKGAWPYPILERINLGYRIVFLLICLISGIGYYLLGEKLARIYSTSDANGVHKKGR